MGARDRFPPRRRLSLVPSGLLLATACQGLVGADFSSAHPRASVVSGSGGAESITAGGGSAGAGAEDSVSGASDAGGAGGKAGGAASTGVGGPSGGGANGGSGGGEPPSASGMGGSTRGGAASSGGSTSQAGNAGDAGAPACEGEEDCSSSDPCLNTACVSGQCQSRPICPDPLETACVRTCVATSLGAASCGVAAPDADGDEHGDATCTLGDDCNDADDEVHPGALERCDGVDNNCNGVNDPSELGLGGQNFLVRALGEGTLAFDTAMAWSPRARSLAVVWEQDYTTEQRLAEIRMNFLGLDGALRFTDDLVVNDAAEGATAPSVAASQDYLGVAWLDWRTAAPGVYFRRFQAASGAGDEPVLVSGSATNPLVDDWESHRPQVVAHADDDWSIFWIAEVSPGADQIYYARRYPTGVIGGPYRVGDSGGRREHLRAATVGDTVAVVWSNRTSSSFSAVEWALLGGPSFTSRLGDSQERLSSAVSPGTSTSATNPVVSSFEGGYDIAFRFRHTVDGQPVESLRVTRRGLSDGDNSCTRQLEGEFYPGALASSREGFALAGYRELEDGARDVLLASYGADCGVTSEPLRVELDSREGHYRAGPLIQPLTGSSGSGFGLVWSRNDFDGGSIWGRFLGKSLCD